MNPLQTGIIFVFFITSLLAFIRSLYEILVKKNPFGLTYYLIWLGIFVWTDALILAFFWILISLICLLLKDWLLFLLLTSIFWLVRSFGETIYWVNQQFTPIIRNPPHTLLGYRFLKNNSVWIIYQISWQFVLMISIFTTLYLANLYFK